MIYFYSILRCVIFIIVFICELSSFQKVFAETLTPAPTPATEPPPSNAANPAPVIPASLTTSTASTVAPTSTPTPTLSPESSATSAVDSPSTLMPMNAQRITLIHAVELAIENSPTLKNLRTDLQIKDMEYKNARSGLWPALNFSASKSWDYKNQVSGSTEKLQFDLTENIYNNGLSWLAIDSSRTQKEITELNYKNERDLLAMNVALQFYNFSLSHNLFEIQKNQFETIEEQYKKNLEQFKQGIKTQREYLKFKTEFQRAEINLQKSKMDIEMASIELRRLLGMVHNKDLQWVPIHAESKISPPPTSAPDFKKHLLYQITQLKNSLSDIDIRVAKRNYWPSLDLTAGASLLSNELLPEKLPRTSSASSSSMSTSASPWQENLFFAAQIKFNLLDWGLRSRQISIAEAKSLQRRFENESIEQNFMADNEKLMQEIRLSSDNYNIAQDLLELEETNMKYLNLDFKNGKTSYQNVILGLRDLIQAKETYAKSYFDLQSQLLKYKYREGQLYDYIMSQK